VRIICIRAHPDDCEIELGGAELASNREREAGEATRRLGIFFR